MAGVDHPDTLTRLAWALEQTGVGLWLNELPFGQLNWDDRTREMFFVPRGIEPTIDLFWERLHPDDREPTRAAVETALRNRTLYAIDHRAVDPVTGEVRWIRSTGRATYADDGTPIRFDGINYDITDRKRTEETLAESQRRLATIVGSIADGFYALDRHWQFTHVNDAALVYFGHTRDQVLGRTIYDVFPAFRGSSFEAAYRRALETGEPVHVEAESVVTDRVVEIFGYPGLDNMTVLFRDVTDRHRAEEALRASEDRLQEALRVSRSFAFEWEPASDRVRRSSSCAALIGETGAGATDDTGQNFFARIHPADRERFGALVRALKPGEDTYETAYRLVRPDSGVTVLEESARAFFDRDGRLSRLVGITTDVTKRDQAEQALRERETQLQAIVEHLDEGVVVADLEGRLLQWNPAALRMHGFASLEEARRGLAEMVAIFDLETLDGSALPLEQWPLARVLRGEDLREWELLVRRIAGGWQRVFSYGGQLVRHADGHPFLALVTVKDVTERKQAERALRESREFLSRAQEIAHLGSWELDLARGQLSWSEEAYRILSVSPAEFDGTYGAFLDAVHPDDRADVDAAYSRSIEEGQDSYDIEHRIIRKATGEVRIVHEKCRHVRDGSGRIVRSVGMVHDVTERKRTEEALRLGEQRLRAANEQLLEADRRKDEFLSLLSHELRTPLNAVVGWSQMLLRGMLDEVSQRRAVEAIARNAVAQTQIVDDVLDVSRIVTGKLRIAFEPVDVAQVIGQAVESVRPAAAAKEIELILDLQPDLVVSGDASRLRQVFWNLLSNAVKFTPAHGHVSVRLVLEDSRAHVRVADSGVGIAPGFLPRAFDRFTQADSSTTRGFTGLGLGLAIVRHLVELHGGTVDAQSEGEGRGATFSVRLPVRAVRQHGPFAATSWAGPGEPAPPADRAPQAACLNDLRVLVIDDDKDAREMVGTVLEGHGATVVTAGSAAAGLQAFSEHAFDVLVADVAMPVEDGYMLMRQIRARSAVPAIALTAHGRAEDRLKALDAGFQQHLPKPVWPDDLVLAVARAAGRVEPSAGG